MQSERVILQLPAFIKGTVVKRPSAICKTPYVADVQDENGTKLLGHTAALGCCGLVDSGESIYMVEVNNKKNVCSHKIMLSERHERGVSYLVGTDPKVAETIVESCIRKNYLSALSHVKTLMREQTFLNSRFDFTGYDSCGRQFILEVKNVPLADYEDCTAKERKKMNFDDRDITDKVAYFPDGYRKHKNAPVSERAIKHIQELKSIRVNQNIRTIICYVIQRSDISSFQPSKLDPTYRRAVQEAISYGVELMTIVCEWSIDGSVRFVRDDILVNLFDKYEYEY
jgi:DNA-binding sugar fermentation-stimulating protein